MKQISFAGAAMLVAACHLAPPKAPEVLSLDSLRESPQVSAAKDTDAFHTAESYRNKALAAVRAEDGPTAELYAEAARIWYERAAISLRLKAATDAYQQAEQALAKTEGVSGEAKAQRDRAEGEVRMLEQRALIARQLRIPRLDRAGADRGKAREQAARALLKEAETLCVLAEWKGGSKGASGETPTASILKDAEERMEAEYGSTKTGRHPPVSKDDAKADDRDALTQALAARTACLALLARQRHEAQGESAPAVDRTDAILATLSEAGWAPTRDERGVVLTFRDLLDQKYVERFQELGKLLKEKSDVHFLLVSHLSPSSAGRDQRALQERLAEVTAALRNAGVKAGNVRTLDAGSALPVVDPADREASSRNTRLEIVLTF